MKGVIYYVEYVLNTFNVVNVKDESNPKISKVHT